MSQSLVDSLPGAPGGGGLKVWLKSSAYTRRLLLGEGADPWVGAPQFLAFFTQAHGLLKPDVAVLEVGELYDSWLARHPDLRAALGAKRRLTFPLRKLLEAEGPRQLLAEVIEAVLANLRGQVPLVLALPSPKHWLIHANELAGNGEVEVDGDSIEDAAMYMADLLRAVSAYPVGGLLLEEHPEDGRLGETDVERYRPLINVAKHYRWGLAWRPRGEGQGSSPALAEFDAVISAIRPEAGPAAHGLDLGTALWEEDAALPALAAGQCYFAEVPETQRPETVLERLATLRA